MKLTTTIATALLAAALMITLPGCEKKGPMEEAGEKIDDAVKDTSKAIEDATDGS